MRLDKGLISRAFERFRNIKILVVGDIILDRYIFGKVERISPEAPVPVVEVEKEEFRLGGAGNVASNLSNLGIRVYLCGVIGNDYAGHVVSGLLKEKGIHDITIEDRHRPTTQKARVVAVSQQLLRIDNESKEKIEGRVLEDLLERLDVDVDAVVVSDYAKGVVCKELMDRIRSKGVFFSVDPRPKNKYLYIGADLMTPNEKEARQMQEEESLQSLGWKLKNSLRLKTLVVTLGSRGMALFDREFKVFPARAKQVYDVTGAGDTVIAVLTAGVLAGLDWEEACELANICAGIVVGKLGTASPSFEEIIEYVEEDVKIRGEGT
ncbi:D-glycero-beta-D-manno-heptose-7-phosphate kinase [Hydrogenobacter thermophilus]|uniref:D-glycero-beta-D-manno-heptose-7-phosphate kinase n=1 Tax=Hydrogenobacter thermophilus TaxID=940 RepID=UPI0030FB6463